MIHPERLGKYEIRGVLGKGAMGIVYKAFDPHIERAVAIKTIRKDMVDPELAAQYMARFKNEAKAAGRLQHPNIVSVYEYGEDDKVTFIAMEYVEGAGLREYLNRRASFDFGQLAALMEQLLDALEFAHARGVVHRDIKPSNLIITNQGQLKVADFGIARVDTSNLLPGYLQYNGVPFSSNLKMVEYLDVIREPGGEIWLIDDAVLTDPMYLLRSHKRSTHLRKQADAAGWDAQPCMVR